MTLSQFGILYRDNLKEVFFFSLDTEITYAFILFAKDNVSNIKNRDANKKKFSRFQNVFLYCIIDFFENWTRIIRFRVNKTKEYVAGVNILST